MTCNSACSLDSGFYLLVAYFSFANRFISCDRLLIRDVKPIHMESKRANKLAHLWKRWKSDWLHIFLHIYFHFNQHNRKLYKKMVQKMYKSFHSRWVLQCVERQSMKLILVIFLTLTSHALKLDLVDLYFCIDLAWEIE